MGSSDHEAPATGGEPGVASLTTSELLHGLRQACYGSSLVECVEEPAIDFDVLKARVHLTIPDTFIRVFYNVATEKTALALVQEKRRTYGADNAKMGWPEHPFNDPEQYQPCRPVLFDEFLTVVENRLAAT